MGKEQYQQPGIIEKGARIGIPAFLAVAVIGLLASGELAVLGGLGVAGFWWLKKNRESARLRQSA